MGRLAWTAGLLVLAFVLRMRPRRNWRGSAGPIPTSYPSDKLVDNTGEGYDALYGTRNVRAVLNGVYYRGGANNYYNKHLKRKNSNPLPDEGLLHLCEEGFRLRFTFTPRVSKPLPRRCTVGWPTGV